MTFPFEASLYGLRLRRQTGPQSSAVEGAAVALFGLLLAFAFYGAVARYDAHRELATRERNYIETAYSFRLGGSAKSTPATPPVPRLRRLPSPSL